VTELDRDPLELIETGDWVKVDADHGLVYITKFVRRENPPIGSVENP
jgi:hypothetical protein